MATPPPKRSASKRQLPPTKKPVSSQRYLDVAQVRDGVLVMRDGSLRAVILVNAINFALKSEDEQNALVYAYQGFLNSFNFPIQIVMQSRQLDLANYLKKLEDRLAETTNELIQIQITDYTEFIERLIQIANIMDKKFYVVVPFQPPVVYQRGVVDKLFHPGNRLEVRMSPAEFKSYRQELLERARIIMFGLASMVLRTALLGTQETIELLYTTYNPEEATKERLTNIESITGAYVRPSVKPAAPAPEPTQTTGSQNPMAEVAPETPVPEPVPNAVSPTPAPVVAEPTAAPTPIASSAPQPEPTPSAPEPSPATAPVEPPAPAATPTPAVGQKPAVAPTEALTMPGELPATTGPIQGEPQPLGGAATPTASPTPTQPSTQPASPIPTPGIGQPTTAAAPTAPVPPPVMH